MRHSKCKICGKEHALGGCPEFQSTAARKDVQVIEVRQRPVKAGESQNVAVRPKDRDTADHTAKTKKTASRFRALPVDTSKPKRGRPKTGFDKLAYNRQFSKDKRAASKLGLTVKEYREGKR